jgi:hypothetical protein
MPSHNQSGIICTLSPNVKDVICFAISPNNVKLIEYLLLISLAFQCIEVISEQPENVPGDIFLIFSGIVTDLIKEALPYAYVFIVSTLGNVKFSISTSLL